MSSPPHRVRFIHPRVCQHQRHSLYFSHPDFWHRLSSFISHPLALPQHAPLTSSSRTPVLSNKPYERNMTPRTFVVFQDDPSVPLPTAKADASSALPLPLVEHTILVPSHAPVTTAEKENLHPVTGTRSGAVTDSQTKKRKNSILATKLHIPPTAKKSRDLALDCRKRKTTTLSSSKSSNGARVAGSGAPDLSIVEEVVETDHPCHHKATQAEVDSKCYDLTVSPLADVSHAFDQISISPAESQPNVSRVLTPKVEPCLLSSF
jgi:hypothetical protein